MMKWSLIFNLFVNFALPSYGVGMGVGIPPHVGWVKNQVVYLDIEDDDVVPVFNKEGQNWQSCADDPQCERLGYPDNNTPLRVMSGTKKIKVINPVDGILTEEEFAQVAFKYDRKYESKTEKTKDNKPVVKVLHKEGTGWINTASFTDKKRASFYGDTAGLSETPGKEYCPPKKTQPKDITQPIKKDLGEMKHGLSNQNVKTIAEALTPYVGQCVINAKNPPSRFRGDSTYDDYVLPSLKKLGAPPVLKENGQRVTQQELIDIDSLARTLYGESAACYKFGLQYPMTVAKVALNRKRCVDTGEDYNSEECKEIRGKMVQGDHAKAKANLAKVLTTDTQFNVWMPANGGKKNESLTHALCPPSDSEKLTWKGIKPSPEEQEIWKNTMRIATEAVLYPDKFSSRTASVKQAYYTSYRDKFYNFRRVFPTIEGRSVSKNCIQAWSAPPRPTLAKAK